MKKLVIFIVVTFGLTWGIWIPAGIATGAFERGVGASPLMTVLVAVGMFLPLVGALAAHFASKPSERIDLCYRPRIDGNVGYYLLAWFAPALLSLLGSVLFFLVQPDLFDPTMMTYMESMAAASGILVDQVAAQQQLSPLALVALILFAVTTAPFVNMIPAFGEELGWRGMLLPVLCERMSERAAMLVSGVIWGLWHAPVIAMGHNYGMDYQGYPMVGILMMVLACTAMGCIMGYLRLRTGSVWPCALAHGAINAVANIGVMFCTAGLTLLGPNMLGLVAGLPMFVVGFVCWLRVPPRGHDDIRGTTA